MADQTPPAEGRGPDTGPESENMLRYRDDAPVAHAAVTVDAFLDQSNAAAVRVEPGDDARDLIPHLERLDLVEVNFPAFGDGRGYSSARILREAGYDGELRAVGDVLVDQLAYMRRCGFDAFEVPGDAPAGQWIGALAGISVRYQPATGFEPTAQELRRHRQPVDDTAA